MYLVVWNLIHVPESKVKYCVQVETEEEAISKAKAEKGTVYRVEATGRFVEVIVWEPRSPGAV